MPQSFPRPTRPGALALPLPYTGEQILNLTGTAVTDGFLRAVQNAPLLAAACAALYHDTAWGVADGFGWAGVVYLIGFWFEVGNHRPVPVARDQHTLWLCPEIDASDVRWWRAGSLLTASATSFCLYAVIRQVLNTL